MKLDLSSLEKVVVSFNEAVSVYQNDPSNHFARDATIQRFEYTYELSHKTSSAFYL